MSDSTRIAGTTWEHMKDYAMEDDYTDQDWYYSLSTEEKKLLELLRTAQIKQGNMDKLKVKKPKKGSFLEAMTVIMENSREENLTKSAIEKSK